MTAIDRLIRALSEALADPTEEAVARCLGMARAMRTEGDNKALPAILRQPSRTPGGWLRAMRKGAGLTMGDAAHLVGISVSRISDMERDQCALDRDIVDRLVDLYRRPKAQGDTDGKQD